MLLGTILVTGKLVSYFTRCNAPPFIYRSLTPTIIPSFMCSFFIQSRTAELSRVYDVANKLDQKTVSVLRGKVSAAKLYEKDSKDLERKSKEVNGLFLVPVVAFLTPQWKQKTVRKSVVTPACW